MLNGGGDEKQQLWIKKVWYIQTMAEKKWATNPWRDKEETYMHITTWKKPIWKGCPLHDSLYETWKRQNYGFDPWLGRSPEEGNGYPLQYSGLKNSMDHMGVQRIRHDWATFTFTFHGDNKKISGCQGLGGRGTWIGGAKRIFRAVKLFSMIYKGVYICYYMFVKTPEMNNIKSESWCNPQTLGDDGSMEVHGL